ncbi:hypothetical protein FHG87_003852 [Trinorchestia longiramus]|nr:hypothetical protein FHG87_003852 [Trinorchestia longiramus]
MTDTNSRPSPAYLENPITQRSPIFTDELKFNSRQGNSQRLEKVNTVTRLVPVTTRDAMSTNERCRSGSRAQPSALHKEAATLCFTDSLPSASEVNISTKNSHHQKNLTHSQQQSEGRRNQPSCLRTG